MTPSLSVGLVGLGTISEVHLQVLALRREAVVCFAVDPDPDASTRVEGHEPAHYGDITDALQRHSPDLVVITSPTATHARLAQEALTRSDARVLVEKPLTHDLDGLEAIRALAPTVDVPSRLFVAHHFAFAPEVRWASELLAGNPEWGPLTRVTCAFNDPYAGRDERSLSSYISSWVDSGANQLSMLMRFVELTAASSAQDVDDPRLTSWRTVDFHSGGRRGTARLFTNWSTGASSKRTTLELGGSGVEIWLDHTAMTGLAMGGSELLATCVNDGATPRKVAHYQPLYESLLSDTPDPILGIDVAAKVVELLNGLG